MADKSRNTRQTTEVKTDKQTDKHMKKIILSIILISVLIACKKDQKSNDVSSDLSQLKQEKAVLTKQLDSLGLRMKAIDDAIAQLQTTKNHQKVTVFDVKDTVFKHYISIQGKVSSDQNLVLTPEMGGAITGILVREGQRVSAGQHLVQFDNQTIVNKINELKVQLALATTTFERQERLWSQQIGSEMQYLQAKSQKEALENALKSLNSQLEKLTLKAPYSGVIDEVFAKKGEMAGSSTPILRLVNLSKMYVESEVPETYLTAIKRRTPVIINFNAIGKEVHAKINEVGSYINPENRSFKIKVNLNNRDRDLKPNLLADLKINDFSTEGIVLPKQIIQMDQEGQAYVFKVVNNDGKTSVEKTLLELGEEYNNNVLVTSGLTVGNTLVAEGGRFLKDHDQISIQSSNGQ
ncbi:MAG: efflux transporter periplasmic adaptor subunit [Flavobacteriia bacterium]|nr:MAG: efflux transporter periplasmic adaptor subunit [Flavobacteriia bacterium]